MDKEYLKEFRRLTLYEFSNPAAANIDEDGEQPQDVGGDPNMGGDPNAMGGGLNMGGDPNAAGGDPNMGGDPNAAGSDPNMGAGPNAAGGDPNMGGDPNAAGGPQGFAPQGVNQQQGLEGMGNDGDQSAPDANGGDNPQNGEDGQNNDGGDDEDEEVIDVDDLTKAQEKTEKNLEKLTSKFKKVYHSINDIEKKISRIDSKTNSYLEKIALEIEKRNPTPIQRMSMRTAKSSPYSMTPDEYMSKYAPDNYSPDSDNNGADDPQYTITKGDIDDFTDYSSAARGLGLHDILGY